MAEETKGGPSSREETFVIDCRHCQSKNRIPLERAVESPFDCVCGNCRARIFLGPDDPLVELDPASYEHPLDRAALKALKEVPGVQTFLKFVLKELPERFMHLHNLQNYVKVSEKQLPKYHEMLARVTRLLALDYQPDLYVAQSPFPTAYTYGVDRAYIVVHSSLLDVMTDEEALGVLAHEASHIHMEHVLFRQAAMILQLFGLRLLNFVPMGQALVWPIMMAFEHWYRCSELSADRGSLLVTRNYRAGVGICMKLAGGGGRIHEQMSADEFLRQGEEAYAKQQENFLNMIMMMMQNAGGTHPRSVWRAGAMKEWVSRGNYLDLIAGHYGRRKRAAPVRAEELAEDAEFKRDDPKRESDFFDSLRGFFDSFTGRK